MNDWRYKEIVQSYERMRKSFVKYVRKAASNNSLKMHGIPMRRRRKKNDL